MENNKSIDVGIVTEEVDKMAAKKAVPKFNKEQLKRSEKYKDVRDVLSVVLKDGESYTMEQVDGLVEKFMNTSYESTEVTE